MLCVIEEICERKTKLAGQMDLFAEWIAECTFKAISACESPIEKAFAGGLLLTFLFQESFGVLVTEPLKNVKQDVQSITAALRRRACIEQDWEQHLEDHKEDMRCISRNMEAAYLAEYPRFDSLDSYARHLLETGKLMLDEFRLLFEDPIVSKGTLASSAFILSPQSVFPGLGADQKNARVDMYIWCPDQPKLQMIVECDGYQYHSDKSQFIADRKRDRNLKRAGYDVYRFAGAELYVDMKKVADEVFATALMYRFG